MTIMEVLGTLDSLKHNSFSQLEKIRWLSKLDGMVKVQILDTHEGGEDISFAGYDEDTPLRTELLVPAPFDDIYLRWLEAQIDYSNGEITLYNASIALFNTAWADFERWYNRTHMPKGSRIKFF